MVAGDPVGPLDDETDAAPTLDALGDAVSREILIAAARSPVTVGQLATACDVSESTVYRRLDRLNTLDLVERCHPVSSDSESAYRTTVSGLYVSVTGDGITVDADEPAVDAFAEAMRLVIDRVDLRQLSYDRDTDTVDVTVELGEGDFETFLGLYSES